jgi:acyl-CoA reductase-like NAD-dependent aldehyde dehydrogenase
LIYVIGAFLLMTEDQLSGSETSSELERSTVPRVRMLIDGQWRQGSQHRNVTDPYRGSVVATVPDSNLADLDAALAAAVRAKKTAAAMPGFERAALIRRALDALRRRTAEIADTMSRETGKAIRDCDEELLRAQDTLSLSAEEAIRIEGAHVPLEGSAKGGGKIAIMLRFPVGVVAGITPFNAPFNLACHKVGPAIAAGNAVVLKAPPQAPLTVTALAEIFQEAGAAPGLLNVLYGETVGPHLVKDPRVDFISFTGSSRVGAQIKASSGLKRVALELGGNASTIVHEDADSDTAAPLCARSGMRLAGQSCISVQNIYVHASVHDRFLQRLADAVGRLRLGDPLDPKTDVGTLIDERAAVRVESWVSEAVEQGARLVVGGQRKGAQYAPTVLADVNPKMRVVCDEIFGPVITVQSYMNLDTVIQQISDGPYGLHCGIFTRSVATAFQAIRNLRVGGVIVNGTSTWRTDQLPYGGIKESGIGREGPRYAIRDMTDERLIVFDL